MEMSEEFKEVIKRFPKLTLLVGQGIDAETLDTIIIAAYHVGFQGGIDQVSAMIQRIGEPVQ